MAATVGGVPVIGRFGTMAAEPSSAPRTPTTRGRDPPKRPITCTRLWKPEGLRSNSRGQGPRFGTATAPSLSLLAAILKGSNLQPSHAASLLFDPSRVYPTCVPRTHRGRCPRLFHASPSGLTDRRVAPRTPDMPPSSELCRAPGIGRRFAGTLPRHFHGIGAVGGSDFPLSPDTAAALQACGGGPRAVGAETC